MTEQLELLADMGRDFAATMDIEAALARALERIVATVGAEAGALFIVDAGAETLVCSASFGPVDITGLTIGVGEGIVGRSVRERMSEMVRDVIHDPNFESSVDEQTGFTTRSILCAPMVVKDESFGAIEVLNASGGDGLFDEDDLHLLETLAASAGLAILNARQAEALVEQEKLRRELELAAEIQRSLLPGPGEEGFPVAGVNLAARVVSGDFYDFFELADGRIPFTLADVSGKGMNAALLMAKTASLFRCLGKEDTGPGDLVRRINVEINETVTRGMFVTMALGVYDPATGRVRLTNAGHEPPLIRSPDGAFRELPAALPPVGILPDIALGAAAPEEVFDLDGGQLYIFTDGVTEGYTADGAELGAQGFQTLIGDFQNLSPIERIESVVTLLDHGQAPLRDDITVLVIDDSGPAAERRQAPAPTEDDATGAALARLQVPAQAESLKLIRRMIETTAIESGFGKDDAHDIMLAVDEACQNVVRHAYGDQADGDMIVETFRDNNDFIVQIHDFAATVDPDTVRPRDLDDIRPGGLGVHFIREVMDTVDHIAPDEGMGNLWRLVKAINKG